MKRAGVTLIELLTVIVISAFLAVALSNAFSVAARFAGQTRFAREELQRQIAFEDRLRGLISRAYVDADEASTTTYFYGRQDGGSGGLVTGVVATELVFTTVDGQIPGAALASTEAEFAARNEEVGPVGGVKEVRLGISPVGEAGGRTGLFLREQTPADEDPDQGGFERVIDERVTSISFEFFDGIEWLGEWSTQTGERRVPAAVRVTYTFEGEETPRVLVIRLKNSDVTPNNPIGATGGTTP